MKRITRLDSFASGLRQEIDWCERQKSIGGPKGYKAGYLAGLRQAEKLLSEVKRLYRALGATGGKGRKERT